MTTQNTLRYLHNIYARFGGAQYTISEPVSILNHSLQTAHYMKAHLHGTSSEIVASLLHDLGHISNGIPIDPKEGIDDKHELKGAQALKELGFPDDITIPISLHVKAKRYLATINPQYKLSEGSKLSLTLQGGLMSSHELRTFERNPYYSQALRLRLADDNAKGKKPKYIRDILFFREYIEYVLSRRK